MSWCESEILLPKATPAPEMGAPGEPPVRVGGPGMAWATGSHELSTHPARPPGLYAPGHRPPCALLALSSPRHQPCLVRGPCDPARGPLRPAKSCPGGRTQAWPPACAGLLPPGRRRLALPSPPGAADGPAGPGITAGACPHPSSSTSHLPSSPNKSSWLVHTCLRGDRAPGTLPHRTLAWKDPQSPAAQRLRDSPRGSRH